MPLRPSFPELGALDLFVSVVGHGSVSQAARLHQISQPSASSRIRHLERQLGVVLLDRSPTGSVPTREGVLVAGWAEDLLRAARSLDAGIMALQADAGGRLRISASFTIAEYLLPPWLEAFLRERPADSVSLEVANSTEVIEKVASGAVDLGFVETPDEVPGMREQVVATDRLVVVVAPSHPWAEAAAISLQTFAATTLILRESGSGTRRALEDELERLGHGPPPSVLELGSTSAVRAAVSGGSSPTVISELAVASDIDAGRLVSVDVIDLDIQRRLRAIRSSAMGGPDLATDLLAELPSL